MNTSAILARARAMHPGVLVDACTVTRATRGALNETTGAYAATTATIYSGPCRIKSSATATKDVATIAADTARPQLVLPYAASGAAGVRPGDRVTITSGPLSGTVYEVYSLDTESTSTARRYTVELIP